MKYIKLYPQRGNTTRCYENFDWSEEDFDFDETPDIDPYNLTFPIEGIINSKWNDYCDYNNWRLKNLTGKNVVIIKIDNGLQVLIDLNKNTHYNPDTYYVIYGTPYWIPFDAIDINT